MTVRFNLNGRQVEVAARPHESLADVLRERLTLTGTKIGCASGECGACTVLVDGMAVNSCVTLIGSIEACEVVTVEGLAESGELDRLQKAFIAHGAFQCGFCTSGMLMSAAALLRQVSSPSDDEIRDALQGNVCRCTGYVQILQAVHAASNSV